KVEGLVQAAALLVNHPVKKNSRIRNRIPFPDLHYSPVASKSARMLGSGRPPLLVDVDTAPHGDKDPLCRSYRLRCSGQGARVVGIVRVQPPDDFAACQPESLVHRLRLPSIRLADDGQVRIAGQDLPSFIGGTTIDDNVLQV